MQYQEPPLGSEPKRKETVQLHRRSASQMTTGSTYILFSTVAVPMTVGVVQTKNLMLLLRECAHERKRQTKKLLRGAERLAAKRPASAQSFRRRRVEHIFCAKYMEALKVSRPEIIGRRAEIVQRRCSLPLDEDVCVFFSF